MRNASLLTSWMMSCFSELVPDVMPVVVMVFSSGMSLATMVKGVEAAIVAASRHATDVKIEGGTLD